MGSYFGHSLTCLDLNGDGYDDLVVGAPWYTDYEDKQTGIPADTGRIYIYYGSSYLDDLESLQDPVKITGIEANSAFGYSMSSAGDMNGDGFNDIFVGECWVTSLSSFCSHFELRTVDRWNMKGRPRTHMMYKLC